MPALPSFMSLSRRNRNKDTKSPFEARRLNTPSSPHPYAASAVFDISHDKRASVVTTVSTVSEGTEERPQFPGAPERSLTMKLDIELSPEPISDWFPPHLLTTEASGSGSSSRRDYRHSVNQLQNSHKDSTVDEDGGMYGDSETSSMSDDVLAKLETLDASHFIGGPSNNKSNRAVRIVLFDLNPKLNAELVNDVQKNCTYSHQNSDNLAWGKGSAHTLDFRFGSSVTSHFSDLINRRAICHLWLHLGASINGEFVCPIQ